MKTGSAKFGRVELAAHCAARRSLNVLLDGTEHVLDPLRREKCHGWLA